MEQLFGDLCGERVAAERSPLPVVSWMFLETGIGILRENLATMRMSLMIRKPSAWLPIVLPLAVLTFVLGHVAMYGIVTTGDEGTPAHIFQLWVLLQVLAVAVFAAKWLPRAPRAAATILVLQVASAAIPMGTVFVLGW
ncbi:hypothetical protein [Actinoplanes subtropicus]|uniref:hypothetical protein n=1 Tax=Actinoplanes subtropicus TaxID=543632 RepID=UPI0012FBF646|nr:hypothetical protein [Actinoplanes subtropicus]